MKNIKLGARDGRPITHVKAGTATFGTGFTVIAGPCAVETEEQMVTTARAVKAAGADMLRGGAFKPRTSPYAFQGHGIAGLKILGMAGAEVGLPIVTEVVDPRDVSWVSEYADMLQIGTRNMQNFALLKEVGQSGKPAMLKRGMYSTLEEWLNCAEYIMSEGNPNVILCERGIRSFEQYTRNTLDLSAVPALAELTHLPVIVDPSHATGRPALIGPMSMASVAVGAAGIMVEVHNNPAEALCDGKQAMTMDGFGGLMRRLRGLETYLAEQDSEGEVTE
jgi:3-deoxy-7-phosphoheptulonate synthase